MDRRIRDLTRRATDDPLVQAQLDHELDRIGRLALAFRGPDPVPMRVTRPPRRDATPYTSGVKTAVARHRTMCASSADALERCVERRTRRAGRHACAEGLIDYYEGRTTI